MDRSIHPSISAQGCSSMSMFQVCTIARISSRLLLPQQLSRLAKRTRTIESVSGSMIISASFAIALSAFPVALLAWLVKAGGSSEIYCCYLNARLRQHPCDGGAQDWSQIPLRMAEIETVAADNSLSLATLRPIALFLVTPVTLNEFW